MHEHLEEQSRCSCIEEQSRCSCIACWLVSKQPACNACAPRLLCLGFHSKTSLLAYELAKAVEQRLEPIPRMRHMIVVAPASA